MDLTPQQIIINEIRNYISNQYDIREENGKFTVYRKQNSNYIDVKCCDIYFREGHIDICNENGSILQTIECCDPKQFSDFEKVSILLTNVVITEYADIVLKQFKYKISSHIEELRQVLDRIKSDMQS